MQNTQLQKDKSVSNIDLRKCLDIISNVEKRLINLSRTIISVGLEHNSKTSRINFVPNLSKGANALDKKRILKLCTNMLKKVPVLKDIERLEKELMYNTNMGMPSLLSVFQNYQRK